MQLLAQFLVVHEGACGSERIVGLTRFESVLLAESVDNHLKANAIA
jgi:hypothetical protein